MIYDSGYKVFNAVCYHFFLQWIILNLIVAKETGHRSTNCPSTKRGITLNTILAIKIGTQSAQSLISVSHPYLIDQVVEIGYGMFRQTLKKQQ